LIDDKHRGYLSKYAEDAIYAQKMQDMNMIIQGPMKYP
jgi:hypothetical protein